MAINMLQLHEYPHRSMKQLLAQWILVTVLLLSPNVAQVASNVNNNAQIQQIIANQLASQVAAQPSHA